MSENIETYHDVASIDCAIRGLKYASRQSIREYYTDLHEAYDSLAEIIARIEKDLQHE